MNALAHVPSAWPDLPAAREEVATFFNDPLRLATAAIRSERIVGWIGAIRHSAYAWELHPLVVSPSHQGRGYGSMLVEALEEKARVSGVVTIWLGADDDFGGTNLHGINLYPDVLRRLLDLAPAPAGKHPFTFYRRKGYTVVGVLPDVDGIGKHDILMAKRIGEKC